MMSKLVRTAIASLAVVGATTSCTSEATGTTIAVTGTNDACELATTTAGAGALTLEFTNKADDISEIYLYNERDEVVAEVENVPTGATRKLNAKVGGGTYKVTCKPGQAGDGFSEKLEVSGDKASAANAGRRIDLVSTEYTYKFSPVALGEAKVKVGERILFEMVNEGTIEHEFEVLKPDGEALGEIGPTKVGAEGKVTLEFTEAGKYTYVCGIDDHEAKGMAGSFEVG